MPARSARRSSASTPLLADAERQLAEPVEDPFLMLGLLMAAGTIAATEPAPAAAA